MYNPTKGIMLELSLDHIHSSPRNKIEEGHVFCGGRNQRMSNSTFFN